MSDVHDMSYYLKCMMGGILACGVTHAAICPLDVVKCRRQANPGFATSLGDGLAKIRQSGDTFLGFGPTLMGYSAQGFGKFGFY
jgi:solute carrier family 25 phosphate transporter 3